MRLITVLAVVLALSVLTRAAGQQIETGLTGIFSTLRVGDQSGDIVGMELLVLGGGSGLSVVAQASEGAPGVPVVFKAQVRGNEVHFDVPESCPCGLLHGRYRGTISSSGITLAGPDNSEPRFLPRGNSYWQGR